MTDVLERLQEWYKAQCDGEWEHQHGIKIETLDNPGWSVVIDIQGTALAKQAPNDMRIERSDNDWIHLTLNGTRFAGAGGSENLYEILSHFVELASASSR